MDSTIRRLTRSSNDRIFAGVCGGFANYLGLDPALARIVFVAATLLTGIGPGVVLYLAAWLLVPLSMTPRISVAGRRRGSQHAAAVTLLAIGILGIAVFALLDGKANGVFVFLGPIAVTVAALYLFFRGKDAASNQDTYQAEGEFMNETSNQVKRLRRSASEKKIAGICGGFGQYFNVDPTLVRVLWVLGALLAFASVFLYLILWVVMPLDGDPDIVTPRG